MVRRCSGSKLRKCGGSLLRDTVSQWLGTVVAHREEYAGLGIRSSVFWANRSFFAQKWANEQFTKKTSDSLIRSCLVSNLSDSLMVAHFLWATWANRSRSLICLEPPERFAHSAHLSWAIWGNRSQSLIWFERNERWAKERIPSPGEFPTLSLFPIFNSATAQCVCVGGGMPIVAWKSGPSKQSQLCVIISRK